MAAETFSSTSTYSPGTGMSFAKDIGSRVLDAATSAKDEKKLQETIESEGGTVPESAKKGLFARALKNEFVTNPINDLKKSFNKKLSGAANVVGLFGAKGRALEDKMLGKKFSMGKGGFDRSGYERAKKNDDGGRGGGRGGASAGGGATLGALVLDIQAIASTVSSMQGLINAQMSISSQMSSSLEDIKNILSDQVTLQQQKISSDEMASREASLEAGKDGSETSKSTSTFTDNPLAALMGMFGDMQKLLGMLKSLPEMIGGFIKAMISKLPGGAKLMDALGGAKKAVTGGMDAVQAGGKGLLKGVLNGLKPGLKAIPFGIGGLLDFGINMLLGEPPGKAAAKAIGSTIGSSLGALVAGALGLVGGPAAIATGAAGAVLGGVLGDILGGAVYDLFAPKEKKMAAGGAMIGEAGAEAVVNLDSAQGRGALGGSPTGMDDVGQTYYSAIAGSTLAVTKEFIDGMGPIGSAVAPAIQDDISKLGKQFELPATSIKMSVGGAGLSPVPGAEKKGEKFLEDLVSGSLEKVNSGKEKTKTDGGGGSGGSGGGDTGSGGGDTGSGAAAPSGAAPAGGPPAPVTAASFGAAQLAATTTSQTTTGGRSPQTVTTVNNKNLQKVTGSNPGKYYYDGLGNVYAIDKDEKRILKPDQLKNGVPGAAGNFNFFRNTNTGVVSLATHQDATSSGFYDYAANAVREPGFGANGENTNIWVPVSDSKQYKGQFTEATPYGKSKISAEGGASATLKKLGNGKLADAPEGRCVTGVLKTMELNKVPNPADTGKESNHPRGLASQLIKNYGWGSISGLGSKSNLKSSYGNVGVNTMNFGQWKTAVKSNKIPSGAIVFMTQNQDWSTNRSTGHDASIAKDGGKKLWSGHWQTQSDGVGAVYGNASQNIIALTPGGQQIAYDGSTSSDDGSDGAEGDAAPENPFEALEKGLQGIFGAIGGLVDQPKTKAEYEANVKSKEEEYSTKYMSPTGNIATPATGTPAKSATPIVIPTATGAGASMRPTDTTQEQRLQRSTTPSGSTAGQLAPV